MRCEREKEKKGWKERKSEERERERGTMGGRGKE